MGKRLCYQNGQKDKLIGEIWVQISSSRSNKKFLNSVFNLQYNENRYEQEAEMKDCRSVKRNTDLLNSERSLRVELTIYRYTITKNTLIKNMSIERK